ncbi:MAG: uridine kinase [Patescibacteria group bacterium]|jgi:uridine kinase
MKPYIIGITGGTASGKTFVVDAIKDRFDGQILVISQDQYYKNFSDARNKSRWERANMDEPDAFNEKLLLKHLQLLIQGENVDAPTYDYVTQHQSGHHLDLEPKAVMVLEGILALCNPSIRKLMDLKVYLEADSDIRLARRLLRDISERGVTTSNLRDNIEWYMNMVKPMHEKYIRPSKKYADLIISTNRGSLDAALQVSKIIEKELKKRNKESIP